MYKYINNPIIMTYLAYIATFGNAIFVLPIILMNFNSIEISIWFLFATINGLAILADSGFGTTLVRATSYFYSGAKKIPKNLEEFHANQNRGDVNKEGLIELIQTSHIIYLCISFFATLLTIFIGYFVVNKLISMLHNSHDLWLAFYILSITVFVKMQSVKWSSFLQGFDKVAIQKQIETIVGFIRILGYVILLSIGMKILELIIFDFMVSLIMFYMTKVVTIKQLNKYHIVNYSIFSFHKKIFYSIFPSTWRFGAIQWGSYMINYGTNLIVSQIPEPRLIASYLVTQRIIFFARQLAQVPLYAELPKVFQMMSKKDFTKLKFFTSKAIFIGIFLLISILIFLGLFGNLFLGLIGVKTKLITNEIFFIMAISIILEFHHAVHAQIYMGSNHIPFLFPALVSGFLILSIGFSVVDTYGLMGIVLTQFFVQLGINNWYPVYLDLKLLNWKFKDYIYDLFIKAPKSIIGGLIKK